jgi:hypothetical protein
MRSTLALFAAAVLASTAMTAAAQTDDAPRRRAPLANAADMEPAVDTGAARILGAEPAPRTEAAPAPEGGDSVEQARTARLQQPASPPAAAPIAAPPAATAPRTGSPRALDSIDLGTTSITGNQELPKVLYIVPWKRSDLGELVGRPVNTLLDEVLTPVDPEVFERHLDYYESLYGKSAEE